LKKIVGIILVIIVGFLLISLSIVGSIKLYRDMRCYPKLKQRISVVFKEIANGHREFSDVVFSSPNVYDELKGEIDSGNQWKIYEESRDMWTLIFYSNRCDVFSLIWDRSDIILCEDNGKILFYK